MTSSLSTPAEARFAPGAILVIEPRATTRRHLTAHLSRPFMARPVLSVARCSEVARALSRRPGRPHLAGVLLSSALVDARGPSTIPYLDLAYPLTPIVMFDDDQRLPEQLEDAEHTTFGPWDRAVRLRRRTLVSWAHDRGDRLREHLLRTLDAYLELVPRSMLHEIRGLSADSGRRYLWELQDIFGVEDVDDVRVRWERLARPRRVRRAVGTADDGSRGRGAWPCDAGGRGEVGCVPKT